MNKQEAERIAAVINVIRPDWRTGLIMSVLEDDRMRHRPYSDALVAMTAMSADPTSKRPGRIHEPGRWWLTVTAQAAPTSYRVPVDADCATCSYPQFAHPLSTTDQHEWEPQHARATSKSPTPEQKAAIKAALKKPDPIQEVAKRKPRDMNDVINSHTDRTDAA